jgi:hypothetical protein
VIAARRAALLAVAVFLLAPASAEAVGFQSPSGNIGCFMTKTAVRCDIRHHEWPLPPKPPSCDVDYGQGVQVGKRRKGSFVCAGDTTLGQGRKLPYGQSIRRGRFRCKSRTDGMRCVNRRNKHGFLLSRERVNLF